MKDEHESLTYMKRAQVNRSSKSLTQFLMARLFVNVFVQSHFEKRISKALLALHTDLKLSLVRYRNQNEMEELSSKWSELSSYDPGMWYLSLNLPSVPSPHSPISP